MTPRRAGAQDRVEKPSADQDRFLPFAAPWFGPEEREEILKVLDSDWITTGPRTRAFEAAFAEFVGCSNALAVSSCTAALHLALSVLDVGPEDAVLTSPFTFAATANVIVHRGAQPVFVDILPHTCNLDPENLRDFLRTQAVWDPQSDAYRLRESRKRLRAIIAVHYGGHPCDMAALAEIAQEFKLAVIEDAAHALGASYRGCNVGTLGTLACFSFYPTKNITTGEGGMLTTQDPALAQRARALSLHGITRNSWQRYSKDGSWQYDVEEAGFKYNLTDLAAALGLHQLRKLPQFMRRREELAALYRTLLAGLPLQLPRVTSDVVSAWHLFPVRVQSHRITRDELIEELGRRNIGTSVHFIPLHLMSYYQRVLGCKKGDFPVAEEVFAHILSLPFFPRMHDTDVERVAKNLRDIFEE